MSIKSHRDTITQSDVWSDNDIVAQVQKGKTHYFDHIITRYDNKIFSYVMGFIKNAEESRDVVQIVFIKTLNHIDSFDCNKKFSSWIYRIAHNETMNWFTKHNQQKTISIDDISNAKDYSDTADASGTALEEWFQIELRDELSDALGELPDQYAQVIRLKYFEDRSYKEISKIIDKPISSVGTLIRRAKKRLLAIVLLSGKY